MTITAASVYSMLRQQKRPGVTLHRTGTTDVECLAAVSDKGPVEGLGAVVQFRREVTISNYEIDAAAWPGPPKKGDQIAFGDGRVSTIQAVLSQGLGEVVMHRLEIVGA